MIILLSGMQRSASTWSYNAVRAVLERHGILLAENSGIFDELDATDAATETGAPEGHALLIKCHFPGPASVRAIDAQTVWNIFTYRDPRGAVASVMLRFNSSFRNASREVHRSLLLWDIYREQGRSLFIGHDAVVDRPAEEIRRIGDYLGRPVDPADAEAIADSLDREKMAGRLRGVERARMREYRSVRHDPETLLTEHHFKGDGISQWQALLNPFQRDVLNHVWGARLAGMGLDAPLRWWLAPARAVYERWRLCLHRIAPFETVRRLP